MPLAPKQEPPYYEITDTPDNSGVKKYIALLSQTTTNDPTAAVLINTIGNIVWTRLAEGSYLGTLTGAFKLNKTICNNLANGTTIIPIYGATPGSDYWGITYDSGENYIAISMYDNTGTPKEWSDVITVPLPITIEVYP